MKTKVTTRKPQRARNRDIVSSADEVEPPAVRKPPEPKKRKIAAEPSNRVTRGSSKTRDLGGAPPTADTRLPVARLAGESSESIPRDTVPINRANRRRKPKDSK